MALTSTFDAPNSRVQLAVTGIPVLTGLPVYVERQVSGSAWTFVRGAAPAYPNAATFNVNDYEFTPNVLNSYRARTDVLYDTFVRTSTSTWGNADSGQTYVATGGTATDFNVAAGIGTMKQSSNTVVRSQTIAGVAADANAYIDMAVSANILGGSMFGALVLRRVDASNYYYAALEFTAGATINLTINKVVAGVTTTIAGPFATGLTTVAAHLYRLRFQSIGTSLFAKVWDPTVTTTEPNAFSLTISDNSLTAGNGVGVWSFAATGNTNLATATVNFDSYHVGDLATTNPAFASLGTASVTPAQVGAWFKFPLRPFLNQAVNLCNWSDEVRPARGEVFQVLGRSLPIAVTELRQSRQFTMTVVTVDSASAEQLSLALGFGDIVYLQTPGPGVYCGLARRSYPQACYAFLGDVTIARALDGRPWYVVTIPATQVSPPDYMVPGASSTWQGIINGFSTWSTVISTFPTWNDVLNYQSSPANEIVG